ncbi:MAG: GGDEF domain-containing protein [Lachnospiraceae bacterium]|nr:GGDEF domain-containing protein [Lachnospiraceae bacterium]
MEDSKQAKVTFVSWSLIGVAFIIIIMFMLFKFIKDGKEMSADLSKDRLEGYASTWAGQLNSRVEHVIGETMALIEFSKGQNFETGGIETCAFASDIVAKTDVSHIYFCRGNKLICDESGNTAETFPLEPFANCSSVMATVLKSTDDLYEDDMLVVAIPYKDKDYVISVTYLNILGEKLMASPYDEVSFLAVMDSQGRLVGNFGKYKDTDSNFLKKDNLIKNIEEGSDKDDYYLFDVRYKNGLATSIEVDTNGDLRTVVTAPLQYAGLSLVYGVRQAYIDKVSNKYFSVIRGTAVKIGIIIVVFIIFVISIAVFNSLKSKERGRELEDKADTDLLTDLYNKTATERKIKEYIQDNPDSRAMMFILDIDNFKKINDTMGHAFGDTLLKTLGKEIKMEFRMTDIIGRTGGDEFMVFLKDVTDDLIIEREANRITKFFHDFKAGGDYVKYSASASIGAAIFPDDAKNFKDLYMAADQALYKAKKRGKNQLAFYNEEA